MQDSILPPRQAETVYWLALGLSHREVAERMVISPETVSAHSVQARKRLGAKNMAHLVMLAAMAGVVSSTGWHLVPRAG
jgi:DNA-binding CsgD family transcriptional regulator